MRNPLKSGEDDPSIRAQAGLQELKRNWTENGILPFPVPLCASDRDQPRRNWFPEPNWISGWEAFEILRLQTKPYCYAPAIARICATISDQIDREANGLNYVISSLPPTHDLLGDFPVGTNQWFRALHYLLTLRDAAEIPGWDKLESDLYDWLCPFDQLRLRASDLFDNALTLDWAWHHYSLPEAKQEPLWDFPKAMAWIATRSYLAMARMGHFRRPEDEDDAVATEGVCHYNTEAVGWLHTALAYERCACGAREEFGYAAFQHCTCISIAWEELVHFMGGLTRETPELVFGIQEGWLSMTWPEGAENLRFMRRDMLERWPPQERKIGAPDPIRSIAGAEYEFREWLLSAFADDPENRRSKKSFQEEAMTRFSGRLSVRGFLRVWDSLAGDLGRSKPGRKS